MPDANNDIKIARLEAEVGYLKDRVKVSEDEIRQLKDVVSVYQAGSLQVKHKLDQIYTALIGDDIGNVGLVKRVANIETVVEWLNTKKTYVAGAVAVLGATAAVGYWIVEKVFEWIK